MKLEMRTLLPSLGIRLRVNTRGSLQSGSVVRQGQGAEVVSAEGAFHLLPRTEGGLVRAVEQLQAAAEGTVHALKLQRLQRSRVRLRARKPLLVKHMLLFQF
ncbi:hypothetical protein PDJAM_G00245770 [Pangasius djambal]|uniref:Uncharacterized protein n=1 Tax=Pangasius djambal TaxID=1691987 RepID=A0ACC5YIQ5_9TELE|nr:hypothetical protein [Pangasius djambal]